MRLTVALAVIVAVWLAVVLWLAAGAYGMPAQSDAGSRHRVKVGEIETGFMRSAGRTPPGPAKKGGTNRDSNIPARGGRRRHIYAKQSVSRAPMPSRREGLRCKSARRYCARAFMESPGRLGMLCPYPWWAGSARRAPVCTGTAF